MRMGLSYLPTTRISPSATGPGVISMIASATASNGVARIVSSIVTAWLTAIPARPVTRPATAYSDRGAAVTPPCSPICAFRTGGGWLAA